MLQRIFACFNTRINHYNHIHHYNHMQRKAKSMQKFTNYIKKKEEWHAK